MASWSRRTSMDLTRSIKKPRRDASCFSSCVFCICNMHGRTELVTASFYLAWHKFTWHVRWRSMRCTLGYRLNHQTFHSRYRPWPLWNHCTFLLRMSYEHVSCSIVSLYFRLIGLVAEEEKIFWKVLFLHIWKKARSFLGKWCLVRSLYLPNRRPEKTACGWWIKRYETQPVKYLDGCVNMLCIQMVKGWGG